MVLTENVAGFARSDGARLRPAHDPTKPYGAVMVLAALGTQVVLASDDQPEIASPASVQETAAREFTVLGRGARETDRPSRAAQALAGREGADASASRRAALPPGSPEVRVLPTPKDVCLLVETSGGAGNAGYGCAPWEHARTGALYVTLSGGPGQAPGEAVIAGLVPDRVDRVSVRRSDGKTDQLALSEGFYLRTGPAPVAIVVGGPQGERVIELGQLPQARG